MAATTWLVLGERPGPTFAGAAGLVAVGVALLWPGWGIDALLDGAAHMDAFASLPAAWPTISTIF